MSSCPPHVVRQEVLREEVRPGAVHLPAVVPELGVHGRGGGGELHADVRPVDQSAVSVAAGGGRRPIRAHLYTPSMWSCLSWR